MSVVNDDYKHIFIHIPKNAGHSMQSQEWVGMKCHTSVSQYQDRGEWNDDYFSWTFVRNPYDRMVSSYHWACEKWSPVLKKSYGIQDSDLESFDTYVKWASRTPTTCPDLQTQMSFIEDKNNPGVIAVDCVGRYETLDKDWDKVCMSIIGKRCPMLHLNKTTRKPWTEYYDNAETRGAVEKLYAEDFAGLDYHVYAKMDA